MFPFSIVIKGEKEGKNVGDKIAVVDLIATSFNNFKAWLLGLNYLVSLHKLRQKAYN